MAEINILRSRSLQQGQRSNGQNFLLLYLSRSRCITIHNLNFLLLKTAEIWPKQIFKGQGHYSKVKGQMTKIFHCIISPGQDVSPYKI